MLHEMKLNKQPFEAICKGQKTIEMRLYDEKRKKLAPKDHICFINRENGKKCLTEIVGLHIFSSFDDLYVHFKKNQLGYGKNEVAKPSDMEQYYSKEEQKNYGVVGIEIKLI